MLEPGKSYKVKVELEPGRVGYGRATVLEKTGSRAFVTLRTAKELHAVLPNGSRLWFVSDSPTSTLNGLWSTTVLGTKLFGGKTAMECGPVKFEPLVQRRKSQRVPFVCPVKLANQPLSYAVRSRNISRSGIGLEANSQYVDEFPVGDNVDIVLLTPLGEIPLGCTVIRTEYNWLNNRTDIGLQFVSMSQQAIEQLERLRRKSGERESVDSTTTIGTTLSGSLRTTRENLRLTKPIPIMRDKPDSPKGTDSDAESADDGGNEGFDHVDSEDF